jgi:hypothetical protein
MRDRRASAPIRFIYQLRLNVQLRKATEEPHVAQFRRS